MATLVAAKRMGLSFDELNQMTMADLMDFTELWLPDDDDEGTVRPATQADINRMF